MSVPVESFCPMTRDQWRAWLQENHRKRESVWLICYKLKSGKATFSWNEAVEEALCFGWIDSKRQSIDEERFRQFFSKRKVDSTWSKINKEKVQLLIDNGRMTEAGLESMELAKLNGSWNILDEVEALIIPDDLEAAFETFPGSRDFFLSLSKSVRKSLLQWLVLAKRKKTRQKRISEIAENAAEGRKPKSFR